MKNNSSLKTILKASVVFTSKYWSSHLVRFPLIRYDQNMMFLLNTCTRMVQNNKFFLHAIPPHLYKLANLGPHQLKDIYRWCSIVLACVVLILVALGGTLASFRKKVLCFFWCVIYPILPPRNPDMYRTNITYVHKEHNFRQKSWQSDIQIVLLWIYLFSQMSRVNVQPLIFTKMF